MTIPSRTRGLTTLVLLGFLFAAAVSAADDWRWTDVDRVVAVSDVHGAYPALVKTLQSAGIIDETLAWQGGGSHLVVTGDVLDRGPQSRDALELLMRLEQEAAVAGGHVHMLLGNHEVMNLTGDLRYVSLAEYAAFADEETPAERDRWYAAAVARDAALTREAFDKKAPPGFFGHQRAFAADGRYGAWLLQQPVMIVINDTAFVHGGLSPVVTGLGLEGVNGKMRDGVVDYVQALTPVIEAGLLLPTDGFYEQAERLTALPADPARPAELEAAVGTLLRLHNADIHEPNSPIWYRGNVGCSPLIEKNRLDAALEAVGASRVVIGHSPTPTRQVLQRMDGRLIEIDTGMLADYYGGSGHALVIEGDRLSVVSEAGGPQVAPAPHPWRVDMPNGEPPAHDLEDWLANGEIVATREQDGQKVLTLEIDGHRIDAAFLPNPRHRGVVPELAAWRLDRRLQLGMVPVTVARSVDGENGVLQLLPVHSMNEQQRSERGDGASAWCPLPLQWQAMYGFDTLAYNSGRLPTTMLYGREDWQLMLVGQSDAFEPRNGRPPYLRNAEISLDGGWVDALTALDNSVLKADLGDVLDKRRMLGLYQRRDQLLEDARAGN